MLNLYRIEEMGEELGREEAGDDYPYIPLVDEMNDKQKRQTRRNLTRRGRGRAQGNIYELRGKAARVFAQNWAMGYIANCEIFEREEIFEHEEMFEEELVCAGCITLTPSQKTLSH